MSTGRAFRWDVAHELAQEIVELLRDWTSASEPPLIAGSVRRKKQEVHDIELVITPLIEPALDIWGEPNGSRDVTTERIDELISAGVFQLRNVRPQDASPMIRNGPAYKALAYHDIPIDLFIVRPPAQRGVIDFLRTGPGDWNQRVVTECKARFRAIADGQVLVVGKSIPTPTERDVFAALRLAWVEPEYRSRDAVRWL